MLNKHEISSGFSNTIKSTSIHFMSVGLVFDVFNGIHFKLTGLPGASTSIMRIALRAEALFGDFSRGGRF